MINLINKYVISSIKFILRLLFFNFITWGSLVIALLIVDKIKHERIQKDYEQRCCQVKTPFLLVKNIIEQIQTNEI